MSGTLESGPGEPAEEALSGVAMVKPGRGVVALYVDLMPVRTRHAEEELGVQLKHCAAYARSPEFREKYGERRALILVNVPNIPTVKTAHELARRGVEVVLRSHYPGQPAPPQEFGTCQGCGMTEVRTYMVVRSGWLLCTKCMQPDSVREGVGTIITWIIHGAFVLLLIAHACS